MHRNKLLLSEPYLVDILDDTLTLPSRTERQQQIAKLEKEIRKLDSKRAGESSSEGEGDVKKKRPKRSHLDEELAKYEKSRGLKGKKGGKKARDEGDVLAKMDAFKTRLRGAFPGDNDVDDVDDNDDRDKQSGKQETEKAGEKGTENDGESAMEVDDDTGFLTHRLYFPKDNNEEIEKAERDYEVIDPRQRSARAREEERERKKRIKPRDGGRGFRR